MTNYKLIKLYSKDKKSLKQFNTFFKKINEKWKNITFSLTHKKRKRQKITILKSPHVNKKAQTQYQSITYSMYIKCLFLDRKKNYILLKKIKNHLFPDVQIKIEQNVCEKKAKLISTKLFSPKKTYYYSNEKTDTFLNTQKLLTFNMQRKPILKETLHFLKVLDNYGHFY